MIPAAYHLCMLAQEDLRPASWQAVFPLLTAIMLVAIVAAPFWPVAMLVAICGVVVHFLLRMAIAGQAGAGLALFGQVGPLLRAGAIVGGLRIAGAEAIVDPLVAAYRACGASASSRAGQDAVRPATTSSTASSSI